MIIYDLALKNQIVANEVSVQSPRFLQWSPSDKQIPTSKNRNWGSKIERPFIRELELVVVCSLVFGA